MHIGHGLVLRWSTQQDMPLLAQAASQGFASGAGIPTERMAEAVYRLMRGDCPAMGPNDFCLIEDRQKEGNPIVACLSLQRYEWTYDGIPLRIARPEIVTSLPDYRHRGLIRALFAAFHERSEAEGCDLQAIVGIPYFYHQMGYAYALNLDEKYLLPLSFLGDSTAQPYRLRDATLQDIPFLKISYEHRRSTYQLWATISDAQWSYYIEFGTRHGEQEQVRSIKIIEDRQGCALGMLMAQPKRWWKTLHIYALEMAPGIQWSAVLPGLLATMKEYGEQMPTEAPTTVPLEALACDLGLVHPLCAALRSSGEHGTKQSEAWYIRIPQISQFLTQITPAIEKHLQSSAFAGWTGMVKINLYSGGVCLSFTNGCLVVEPWQKDLYAYDADVSIAPHQFWQLILGYRGIDQLQREADAPDILVGQKEAQLLNALFPPRPSFVPKIEFK